jgi:bifunctional UDP-N-acetylglucosamine pyrophosphorylase/glucosamine-1-phosphate N-acetyltransferase/UDP-N-acetylglucosamine pyrophosphorylase
MIDYLLDTLSAAGIERIVVVIGYRAELVRAHLAGRPGVEFAEQFQQLGTGHAVMMCRPQLAGHQGLVLVVAGDSPLTQRVSLQKLMLEYQHRRPACLLGTTHKEQPRGLGRIVRDAQGAFQAIVEEKDATEAQRQITEVNMSCYVFNCADLLFALDHIRPENAQAEFYLTDCPGVLKQAGRRVEALPVLTPVEALSINTPEELAIVERAMQNQNA